MRILHFIDHFATGGAQVFLADVLESWPNKEDRFHVVGLGRADDLTARFEQIPGVTVERLKARRWNPSSVWRGLRLVREGNYDIVHAHLVKAIGVALLAGLLQRKKTVVHLHGGRQEFPALIRAVYRMLRGGATRVIAVSDAIRDFARDELRFPADRIHVVHNGVRVEAFQDVPADNPVRDELNARREAVVVGMAGRLVEQKGVDVFLRAFALVRDREPRAIAAVVGGGPLRENLQRLAADLGCSHAVRFMGWRKDMPLCYGAFDIGVVPSRWEPFGIVTVEMMAGGLPTVACAVDGIREIVTNGADGLLVPPRDPQALADAILGLILRPELREQLGRAARRTAATRFHIRNTAEQIRSVYVQMGALDSDAAARPDTLDVMNDMNANEKGAS